VKRDDIPDQMSSEEYRALMGVNPDSIPDEMSVEDYHRDFSGDAKIQRGRSKYGNQPMWLDGYYFDSKAEARHYAQLRLAEEMGDISELQVHPRYKVADAPNGETDVYYEADFAYRTREGKLVVVDVKGFETQAWKIKRKLFMTRYPELELVVVKA
jgi:hypothetical protein